MKNRIEILKNKLQKKPSICIQRAKLWTKFFKFKTPKKEPQIIKQAKAISYVLNNLTPKIYAGELLVGSFGEKKPGAIYYPDLISYQIITEIFSLDKRKINPFQISLKEKLEILFLIFPYWFKRAVIPRGLKNIKSIKNLGLMLLPGTYFVSESAGISHLAPNYENIIKYGVKKIIKEAKEKLKKTKHLEKKNFYKAIIISAKALISFAHNYRDEALRLAKKSSGKRKKELTEIAKILNRIPAYPATNFREALQSLWLTHIAVFQENYEQAITLGRLDQILEPYYKNDKEQGKITDEQVKELLSCLWIKASEIYPLFNKYFTKFFGGYLVGQGLTIGGLNQNYEDATNKLSYLFLEVADEIKTRQPNFFVRISSKTTDKFLKKSLEVIKNGGGMPALHNDDIIIPSLINRGVSKKDALNYCIVGCVEQTSPGNTFGSTDAALINLPLCLEMALFSGKTNIHKIRLGVKTKPAENFKTFAEVIYAFKTQVEYLVKNMVESSAAFEKVHSKFRPTPFLSMLIDGTMQKGKDVTSGGAKYNFSGVQGVGLADVADSLMAIKTLVFEEKTISLKELLVALRNNFKEHKKLQLQMLNKVPKFGNDNEQVDNLAKLVQEIYCKAVEKHTNTRGGKFHPGFYSLTCHLGFGQYTGALPSGRNARQPLANGLSPVDGQDKLGPTATLNSVSKLNYKIISNGCAFNQKFEASLLKGDRGTNILFYLIKTFFQKKAMQVQINILSTKELLEAKKNPQKYPNLMVRIAGYSAYFIDLSPQVQDEIIRRTTQVIA